MTRKNKTVSNDDSQKITDAYDADKLTIETCEILQIKKNFCSSNFNEYKNLCIIRSEMRWK